MNKAERFEQTNKHTSEAISRYTDNRAPAHIITRSGGLLVMAKGFDSEVTDVSNQKDLQGTSELPPGSLRYVMTTDVIDRANDRVDPTGANLKNFARNSPALWCHMQDVPNAGKWANLIVVNNRVENWRGIAADIIFHQETNLSRDLYSMAAKGFLPAVSIGFVPLAWQDEDAKPYVDRGEASPFYDTIRTYKRWELLECSLCNVPMNPTALQETAFEKKVHEAVQRGIISQDSEIIAMAGLNYVEVGTIGLSGENLTTGTGDALTLTLPTPATFTTSPLIIPTEKITLLTQLSTDMNEHDLQALAEKSGLTVEQIKSLFSSIQEKGVAEQIAVNDAMEDTWEVGYALSKVTQKAVEVYAETGDATLLDALPAEYQKAGEIIVGKIKAITTGNQEKAKALLAQIAKAGNTLNKTNKKLLSEAATNIKAVLASAGEGEEEADKSTDKSITDSNDDGTTDIAEKLATMDDDLIEMKKKLDIALALLPALVPQNKSIEVTPVADESTSEVTDESPESETPIVDLSEFLN